MALPGGTSAEDWNRHWHTYAGAVETNPAQAYRRKLIFEALDLARARGRVRLLEIGCGIGDFSRELTERYPAVELTGLDRSETALEVARRKVPEAAFFLRDLGTEAVVAPEHHTFATHAVCSEVLEHLEDPVVALRHARDYLAPGARLVVTVPAGPVSAFDRHIGHRGHFTPERLCAVLEGAGLEVSAVFGAGFPFFNLYRLMVVLRGEKLIDDVAGQGALPMRARAAMGLFSLLFRFNSGRTRYGWQLVATAREPGGAR
jgi:SAM-dependent methyltransferase